jgi:MYXO-CTERM domain-containing protein
MKKLKTLLFVAGLTLTAGHASAAILLSAPINVDRNDYGRNLNDSLGYQFTSINATTTINFLGYNDADGDGLLASHKVSLWELDGGPNYKLVAFTTVAAGTVNALDGGYRWGSIAGVTLTNLTANGYIVMAETIIGGDKWGDNDSAVFNPTIGSAGTSGLVSNGLTFAAVGNVHTFLSGEQNPNPAHTYNGGNIATSIVPEPSAALLGALGLVSLVSRRRR